MSHDPHFAWEIAPFFIFGAVWIGSFILDREAVLQGRNGLAVHWLGALQMTALFSLVASPGLAAITDRLTQTWPDYFPLLYMGLFGAFFAPLWLWNPTKDGRFTWRGAWLVFFYMIPVTFVFALGQRGSIGYTMTDLICVLLLFVIVGAFLFYAWVKGQDEKLGVIVMGLVVVFIACWIPMISWLATRMN